MTRRTVGLFAVLLAVVGTLSGCADIPRSSGPDIIGPVAGPSSSASPSFGPQPGSDPRQLVVDFLTANASDDPSHNSARQFLTPDASRRWSDTSVTVLSSYQVSTFDSVASTITVSGNPVGSIDANGVYTPTLNGDGSGGEPVSFELHIRGYSNAWRIDQLKNGLLINLATFQTNYDQLPVYFLDLGERHLVPDARYTVYKQASDPVGLVNWLVAGLAAGPSQQLETAVTSELPANIDPNVTIGDVISVTLPGASQLDGQTRYRLAAQLAATLGRPTSGEPIELFDGGRPLTIPGISDPQFNTSDFQRTLIPAAPSAPALYYVKDGAMLDVDGKPLPGALGSADQGYGLDSVAVAPLGADDLRIAGITGSGNSKVLRLGTRSQGLQTTSVTGPLTRPSWAPGLNEVWVGNGTSVLRVADGTVVPVPVTSTSGGLALPVLAVRISPEGSRVAMVLQGPDGTAQLWIGAIVRASGQVRVDGLTAISPVGVALTDVAWNDGLKLFVTGRYVATSVPNVFEVQVDGSLWTPRTTTNLPGPPESITVTENANAWVSAGGAVWTQRGSSWISPGGGEVAGENPVYVE